ncbi:hypothetical protein PVAP13_8KG357903 [Panicum virgatum]|uniref:Uncharacterized protein n=1 Tax=Panicum virgatum TaxID=38727 RepID=A0A8T0PV59_PANVG|nr:hypothetical protein PVAP13_8KG357903 [Panicum virgatum]
MEATHGGRAQGARTAEPPGRPWNGSTASASRLEAATLSLSISLSLTHTHTWMDLRRRQFTRPALLATVRRSPRIVARPSGPATSPPPYPPVARRPWYFAFPLCFDAGELRSSKPRKLR